MQAIERPFNREVVSQLENLTAVAGYLRGTPFTVETYEPGVIPAPVLTYIHQLQEANGLAAEPDMSNAVVDLLNTLLVEKKYQDPVYIRALHDQLRPLGYAVPFEDYDNKQYNSGTAAALQAFQKAAQLPVTGSMDLPTEQALATAYAEAAYTVKGTVHDANWNPVTNATVDVFEKKLRTVGTLLQSGTTDGAGEYALSYYPIADGTTGEWPEAVHVVVRIKDGEGTLLEEEVVFNAPQVLWVNHTAGERPFKGEALYTQTLDTLNGALEGVQLKDIEESEQYQDVTYLYNQTGTPIATIMQLYLAQEVATALSAHNIPAPVLFAFFKQQLPAALPSYLMPDEPSEWTTWTDELVSTLAVEVALMPAELQEHAFDQGVYAQWLPLAEQQDKTAILQRLGEARLAYAKNAPVVAGRLALSVILDATSLEPAKKDTLAEQFAQRRQLSLDTLQQWYENALINEVELEELQQELQLAALGGYENTTIQQLRAAFGQEGYSTLINKASDFAKWTNQDWELFGMPVEADPLGGMKLRALTIAPTVATFAALGRSSEHSLEHVATLATFVDDQQLLYLGQVPIDTYLQENSLELPPAAVEELKLIQRVEHLSPQPEQVPVLLGANIHSAYQAHQIGEEALTQIYVQAGIDEATAKGYGPRTYAKAEQTLGTLTGMSVAYGLLDGGGITPASITPLPNLEDLFGNNDFCGCSHCRSVYSPAAYLTDLLHWLKGKSSTHANKSALDILLERRPDLEHILLNCKNANTPLPYIDLVCEVLEYAIEPTPSYEKRNTTWRASELKARSEHRLDAVYERLAKLPSDPDYRPYASYDGFNIWQAQVYEFLPKLGVTVSQLVQLLKNTDTSLLDEAAATFELPSHEALAITTQYADVDEFAPPNRNVADFLHDHQLDYEQLLMLLEGSFTNLGGTMSITPEDSCDLDVLEIASMNAVELDRLWRFLRLWKYTDWSIWELDHLISNPLINNGVLDALGLERLAKFYRLQRRLGVGVHELLGLMGQLDSSNRKDKNGDLVPSFYEEVYYHRLLDDSQRAFFDKNNLTLSLAYGSITKAQIAYIGAALGLTGTQVENLLYFPQADQWTQVLPQRVHQLSSTADGLGLLYAYAKWSQQLRISVEDLQQYLRLLAPQANPFDGLDAFEDFLDHLDAFQAAGLDLEQVQYLLTAASYGDYLPFEQQVNDWQNELFRQTSEAYDNAMISQKTEEDTLRYLLRQTNTFNTAPPDEVENTEENISIFLEVLYQVDGGDFTGNWTPTDRTNYITGATLAAHFAYADGAAFDQLKTDLTTNTNADPAIATLKVLLHRRLHSVIVFNYLSELWEVPAGVIEYLLADGHPVLGREVRYRLLEEASSSAYTPAHPLVTAPTGTVGSTPPSFLTIYRRLLKYVFVVKVWDLTAADLEQLELATAAALPNLDLGVLTLSAPSQPFAPIPHVEAYLHTAQWVRFAQQHNCSVADLVAAILALHNTGDISAFFTTLNELIGWDQSDMMALHVHFQWSTANYTAQVGHWEQWRLRMQLLHQLGVANSEALSWLNVFDTAPNYFEQQRLMAQQIQNAVREASTPDQWQLFQQEIQDQIRLQKRNALVAYARNYDAQGNRVRLSSHDLYHLHLIDPEMSACQLTSRIKQAISAVQLFVQRCRLGLEQDDVKVLEGQGWEQWQWMQYYRVWEANRKVFLYPENWIEPALRDNKSELFKQFEEEILQQEVTQENVELALQNYLVRLNDIANLEMMSIARAYDAEQQSNVSYVLARTKENPAVYYYRKINDKSMEWTGWEKIPFDVQGEHPVLQVYNDKLHLFWLQIVEKPEELVVAHDTPNAGPPTTDNQGTPTVRSSSRELPNYKVIQLAWSVLSSVGWSPQQLSKKKLIHPWPRPNYSLHLRPRHKGHDLWIDLYVSTSPEFNNNAFYNQFEDTYKRMTLAEYNPERTPRHSSSFVFDGFVRKIKLFGIAGDYWTKQLVGVPVLVQVTNLNPNAPLWIVDIENSGHSQLSSITYETNRGDFSADRPSTFIQLINNTTLVNQVQLPHVRYLHSITRVTGARPNYRNMEDHLELEFEVVIKDPSDNRPVVDTAYLNMSKTQWNNLFANGDPNVTAAEPRITVDSYIMQSTSEFAETYQKVSTDSYNYVYHNYGEEGRGIDRLLPHERALVLYQSAGVKYRYNKFISFDRTGNHSFTPHGVSTNISLGQPFTVTIPMENTHFQHELGNHFTFQVPDQSFLFLRQGNTHTGYRTYHPYARAIQSQLGRLGVEGLYDRDVQLRRGASYAIPTAISREDVSFQLSDGYGIYNWEIFFHIPFLIATELSKNQRFEEAMAWFHCIFNPLGVDHRDASYYSDVSRYWITKPFFEHTQADYLAQQIQNILGGTLSSATQTAIETWKNNPFQPHVVARMRPVAYQKAIVMKYIDNIIAWGDQLFRRETLESINQAGLMYVLAAELLGERPQEIAGKSHTDQDYETLSAGGSLNAFSNAMVLENMVIATGQANGIAINHKALIKPGMNQLYSLPNNAQYFCIPNNEKLQGYWDLVEDRLFKIRHCMDIDGRVRQLPLFAPPIDPALLVNAAANGVNLDNVLQDLAVPKPHYKYRPLGRLASQFTAEVKALGQSLLSALQSRDAEGMALLQSGNAIKVLDAAVRLKQLQIEEAQENIGSLEISKKAAEFRRDFYANRAYISGGEKGALELIAGTLSLDLSSTMTSVIASALNFIPRLEVVATLTPGTMVEAIDGAKLAAGFQIASTISSQQSNMQSKIANIMSTKASYDRRQEEWDFQAELAERDIEQIDQQIAAAKVRVAIAERDLQNHQIQIDNARSEQEYLQSKYTNQQLYSWMVGQLSTTYFQAYHLALDVAKRAEKSLNYELGLPTDTPRVIQHGYWDSLRKGLLAGDKLMLAINQLEDKYVRLNQRELELTKHISLHQWAPDALLQLKTTGKCQLNIPEWWFDMDYPGHYLRRIKALTVSIPCIVGPNTNVNATLTLSRHSLRRENVVKGAGYNDALNLEERYELHEIATSSGQNDGGVFELNFNDERFLPFEGLGAISTWTLELPTHAQFDYKTITDVVFHLRYTARNGGARLAGTAKDNLNDQIENAAGQEPTSLLVSAREAFPTAWHRFKNEGEPLRLNIEQDHYPFFTKMLGAPTVVGGSVGVVHQSGALTTPISLDISATNVPVSTATITIDNETYYGAHNLGDLSASSVSGVNEWVIANSTPAEVDAIDDIYLLLVYKTV